jgi:hypothetical protein
MHMTTMTRTAIASRFIGAFALQSSLLLSWLTSRIERRLRLEESTLTAQLTSPHEMHNNLNKRDDDDKHAYHAQYRDCPHGSDETHQQHDSQDRQDAVAM